MAGLVGGRDADAAAAVVADYPDAAGYEAPKLLTATSVARRVVVALEADPDAGVEVLTVRPTTPWSA